MTEPTEVSSEDQKTPDHFTNMSLRDMDSDKLILPAGYPDKGEVFKNASVKGLSLKGRRKAARMLNSETASVFEIEMAILEDGLLKIGPYEAPFPSKTKKEILGVITDPDRQFLAWMTVLDNYRGEDEVYAIKQIDMVCTECGGDRKSLKINPWNLPVCVYDSTFWRLEGSSLQYTTEHRGVNYTLMMAHSALIASLPETDGDDLFANQSVMLAKCIVKEGEKLFPYTVEQVDDWNFVKGDLISRATRLNPSPGLDVFAETKCKDCGQTYSNMISLFRFILAGAAS